MIKIAIVVGNVRKVVISVSAMKNLRRLQLLLVLKLVGIGFVLVVVAKNINFVV
jgi:hypothetical protein